MTRIYVSHSSERANEGANECDVWQHTLKITRAVNCRVNCKYKTKTMFLASYTLRNRFMCSLDSTLYVKIKWMTSNRRLLFLYSATTHLYCWMDRWTHFHCIFRSFLLFLLYHNETFNVTTFLFSSSGQISPIRLLFFHLERAANTYFVEDREFSQWRRGMYLIYPRHMNDGIVWRHHDSGKLFSLRTALQCEWTVQYLTCQYLFLKQIVNLARLLTD